MVHLTKTTTGLKAKEITREWHLFDAKKQVLGRLACRISEKLIGKHKVYYDPHLDCGDNVVVIHATDIIVTGKKNEQKMYTKYSGYPGGLKTEKYKDIMNVKPEFIIEKAVQGMLPKNKLRKKRMTRLYIFKGSEHPFTKHFTS